MDKRQIGYWIEALNEKRLVFQIGTKEVTQEDLAIYINEINMLIFKLKRCEEENKTK